MSNVIIYIDKRFVVMNSGIYCLALTLNLSKIKWRCCTQKSVQYMLAWFMGSGYSYCDSIVQPHSNLPSKGLDIVFPWFVGKTAVHAEVFPTLIPRTAKYSLLCKLESCLSCCHSYITSKVKFFWFYDTFLTMSYSRFWRYFLHAAHCDIDLHLFANFGYICIFVHILWIFDTYFRRIS